MAPTLPGRRGLSGQHDPPPSPTPTLSPGAVFGFCLLTDLGSGKEQGETKEGLRDRASVHSLLLLLETSPIHRCFVKLLCETTSFHKCFESTGNLELEMNENSAGSPGIPNSSLAPLRRS